MTVSVHIGWTVDLYTICNGYKYLTTFLFFRVFFWKVFSGLQRDYPLLKISKQYLPSDIVVENSDSAVTRYLKLSPKCLYSVRRVGCTGARAPPPPPAPREVRAPKLLYFRIHTHRACHNCLRLFLRRSVADLRYSWYRYPYFVVLRSRSAMQVQRHVVCCQLSRSSLHCRLHSCVRAPQLHSWADHWSSEKSKGYHASLQGSPDRT